MSTLNLFKLPDVGEGLLEAEIVSWKVKLGDIVAVNDVIVEIETAKSLVELPSPYAGMVAQLMVAEGETVEVGTPIIAIGSEAEAPAAAPAAPAPVAPAAPEAEAMKPLVGSGPKADAVKRRPRTTAPAAVPTQAVAPAAAPVPTAAAAAVAIIVSRRPRPRGRREI